MAFLLSRFAGVDMSGTLFEVKDVSYSYLGKFPALNKVSLSIHKGEKVAVIGANGSGKSTLLHLLDGLVFPERGTVEAFGRPLTESALRDDGFSREFRSRVGFVFQNPDVQLFCPTVREDIVFGPLQMGIGKDEIARRMEKVVDILVIGHLIDRSPHQLSIGEKRKVAIASTLMVDPEVLILDEPTAGLDPHTVRHIMDLLVEANAAGKTVVTTTHDLHIVEELADTVFVFGQDKSIVGAGATRDILKDCSLLEEHNLMHVHSHRHQGVVHVHHHCHADHHGG